MNAAEQRELEEICRVWRGLPTEQRVAVIYLMRGLDGQVAKPASKPESAVIPFPVTRA